MVKAKHLYLILIPAILLAGFALFIRIIQYEPLHPKIDIKSASAPSKNVYLPIELEDPVLGSTLAPRSLVIFSDFACVHCRDEMTILRQLLQDYPGKFKLIIKGLPVARFPYKTDRAQDYAYCANSQGKYADFELLAFANGDQLSEKNLADIAVAAHLSQDKLTDCLKSGSAAAYREKNTSLAETLNISTIPAVFLNNERLTVPATIEEWKSLLKL